MPTIFFLLLSAVLPSLRDRAALQLELIALRHQLLVLERKRTTRPRLSRIDRFFWVWLYRLWPGCVNTVVIVKPETVIRWHRRGFRLFWSWKSRPRRRGRPPVPTEVRDLIRRMSRENPLWGAPRIHGELLKLGIEISQATVSKVMIRHPCPPSQTWRTFLTNHVDGLASIDLFVPVGLLRGFFHRHRMANRACSLCKSLCNAPYRARGPVGPAAISALMLCRNRLILAEYRGIDDRELRPITRPAITRSWPTSPGEDMKMRSVSPSIAAYLPPWTVSTTHPSRFGKV